MINVFKFAGVSRTDGALKPRFASDKVAVKVIEKKDPNADMVELPQPMGKIDAINYLFSIQFHMVNADQVDTEVNEVLTEKLQYLKEKNRLARGEFKPKGRKATEGKTKPVVVVKEPDPVLAPYGWKNDGTPKAAPGRKAGTAKVKEVVIKEPDPILAPYGWKKDGTPKAAPGRKAQNKDAATSDAGVTLQSIMEKKIETATTVENPALEEAPF